MRHILVERFIKLNGPFVARVLRELAFQVEHIAPGPPRAAVLVYLQGKEVTVGEITVSDELTTLNGSVSFLDAKGAATTPDGTPAWTSSDESVATVVAAADGLSAVLTIGTPGVTLIEVRSQETDNETGEPYEVVSQGTLTVQPGDAVIGSVEFTTPT